ncbi:MAG: type II toxin-antitoxin system VapC family toxin [Acetobacteraceae bacterium]|nr:type II toxin-antitoxin system VapC family toxin [Acetobacteraceae bacterium]
MTGPLIADACAVIAYHGSVRVPLSREGEAAMQGGDVLVSAITIWEITRKAALGKLPPMTEQGPDALADFLRRMGHRLIPLTAEAAELSNRLPWHHADPMDRMLIATAMMEGATIISSDRIFAAYGVPLVW